MDKETVLRSLAWLFFGRAPCAVAYSLKNKPQEWTSLLTGEKLYELKHKSGIIVWVANSVWGVDVFKTDPDITGRLLEKKTKLWGGLTIISAFYLSPGHWLIWNATKPWRAKAKPEPETKTNEIIVRLSLSD